MILTVICFGFLISEENWYGIILSSLNFLSLVCFITLFYNIYFLNFLFYLKFYKTGSGNDIGNIIIIILEEFVGENEF